MTRVILSLQATHTALDALRRNELSCAVASQVTENRRAAARPEAVGESLLPYGAAAVGSWLPLDGAGLIPAMFGKDSYFHTFLTLCPSSKQDGDP